MGKSNTKCYQCIHRLSIPGDCHSKCNNKTAKVEGNPIGIRGGWFHWPFNFDPIWLVSCDGFSDNPEDKKPEWKAAPLIKLFSMLR